MVKKSSKAEFVVKARKIRSQHFPNSRNFGGEDKYEIILFRDKLKKQLCEEHGIEVIYFTHEKIEGEYLGKVFTDINDLIEYINSKE